MAKMHDRWLEIVFTTTNGAQQVVASKVNYYRSDSELNAGTPFTLTSVFPVASASPYDIVIGELLAPPTKIRLNATISA